MSSTKTTGGGSASARAQLSFDRLLSRNALIVAIALAAAIALAWAWLATTSGMTAMDMAGMRVEPWSAAYLLSTFVMWALMMVAMMLPSAAPMILLHARIDRAPEPAQRLWHTAVFTLAYVLIWTGFSAAAALAQALLVDLGLVSAMSLALGERGLAAALLVAAGLYQLTGAKEACLDQCRSPVHFIMRYWRPGTAGALRLGLAHGVYCLGCCWGLMLLLFVGGVMNLAWVAFLAAVVLAEKLVPPSWHLSKLIAAALFAGAVIVIFSS